MSSNPPQRTTVHEYRPDSHHRIVLIEHDGRRSEGQWVSFEKFAHHRGLYATTSYWEGELPVGVFRLNPIPHEVLDVKPEQEQPP